MLRASSAFLAATLTSHNYARELWACDEHWLPAERLPFLAASSATIGTGLVRTTLSASIANTTGAYTPRPGGLVWWDRPLLVRFGIEVAPDDWDFVELPLLWPDEPEVDVTGRTVRLEARDAFRLVSSDSKLARPLTFEEGSTIRAAVRAILEAVGAPKEDRFYDLWDGGAGAADATYEAGAIVGTILGQWLVDYGLDLYAAAPARFTMRPVPDPLTVDPVSTWAIGRDARLVDFKKRWRNRAKNHAIVEGRSVDGDPIFAEAFDRNPASPVQFGKPGVPDLLIEWKSDGITTEEQAEKVGRGLLVRNAVEEEIEATIPVNPALTRGDVIRIEEPATNTVGNFALQGFPLPLLPGGQSFTVRRERALA